MDEFDKVAKDLQTPAKYQATFTDDPESSKITGKSIGLASLDDLSPFLKGKLGTKPNDQEVASDPGAERWSRAWEAMSTFTAFSQEVSTSHNDLVTRI